MVRKIIKIDEEKCMEEFYIKEGTVNGKTNVLFSV